MKLYLVLQLCFVACNAALTQWKHDYDDVNDAAADTENIVINDVLIIQLLRRVQHLESRDIAQQSEIETLRLQLQTEKRRTTSLEATIRHMKHGNKLRKQTKVKDVDGEMKNHIKMKPSVVANMNLKTKVNYEDEKLKGPYTKQRIRRDGATTVGFCSTLTVHLDVKVNRNIIFDNIVTNVGNAYNQNTGDFIAPVPGMYVFSVTIMALRSDSHFEVTLNGQLVSNIYSQGGASPFSSSSQTLVLVLQQGDDVSVRNKDSDETLFGFHYTSFSGFLLEQHHDNTGAVLGK